jgi:hypothetical protein
MLDVSLARAGQHVYIPPFLNYELHHRYDYIFSFIGIGVVLFLYIMVLFTMYASYCDCQWLNLLSASFYR